MDGRGVDSATPHGLVVGGKEYPLDILILSTGYRSPAAGAGNPAANLGIEIVGRGGRSLTEKWTSQGPTLRNGFGTNGFPNLFWHGTAQTGATANFAHLLGILSRHIVHIVAEAHDRVGSKDKDGIIVEVTVPAEETWSMKCLQGAAWFAGVSICTPSYATNEGEATAQVDDPLEMMKRARGTPWGYGMISYIRELEAWQIEGKMNGIDVSVA